MSEINIDQQLPEINIENIATSYHLPIASSTTLGGIKVGHNLNIEDDGTLNSEYAEYHLPAASTNVLGGVRLGDSVNMTNGYLNINIDSSLNNSSHNPIENRIITGYINNLTSTAETLTSTVGTLSDNYDTLSTTVSGHTTALSTLNDTVEAQGLLIQANTDNIAAQGSSITDNASAIDDLDTRVDTAEDNITTINSTLTDLTNDDLVTLDYSELSPSSTWTAGNIFVIRRGKVGYVYIDLEGSLTLAATSSEVLYTFTDVIPLVKANATVMTDSGAILGEFDDYTYNLSLVNLTSSSLTITKVKGVIPIVFA